MAVQRDRDPQKQAQVRELLIKQGFFSGPPEDLVVVDEPQGRVYSDEEKRTLSVLVNNPAPVSKQSIWDSVHVSQRGPVAQASNKKGYCHYCNKRVVGITNDHVVPKSLIERHNRDRREGQRMVIPRNLVKACRHCNGAKSDLRSSCDCGKCLAAWEQYVAQGGSLAGVSGIRWVPPRMKEK